MNDRFSLKMNLFSLRILILSAGIAGLYQIGDGGGGVVFNSINFAAWGQAVPLIPVQTGNATLNQGIPVFYDCIEEAVDESYSEQEPSYFHDEPTKAEVNNCYYDVFVVNADKLESDNQIDTVKNSEEGEVEGGEVEEGEQEKQGERGAKRTETGLDTTEKLKQQQQQGPESFMVTPW
ncbi:MAG: hypothetical protein M3297_09025 [Thermoproteota archaeon]|nr:hypothetical protein [Thermoproteota archaeon]